MESQSASSGHRRERTGPQSVPSNQEQTQVNPEPLVNNASIPVANIPPGTTVAITINPVDANTALPTQPLITAIETGGGITSTNIQNIPGVGAVDVESLKKLVAHLDGGKAVLPTQAPVSYTHLTLPTKA